MFKKILQKITFKKEELKDNKDWVLLLDIFNRNPQLLLDFVFDEENGGMGITNDIIAEINENSRLPYSKNWSWILGLKQFKIQKEIKLKENFLKEFERRRGITKKEHEVVNEKIQELEIELKELQKKYKLLLDK